MRGRLRQLCRRRWLIALFCAFALPPLWLGLLAARICAYASVSSPASADAAVVLGAAIAKGRPMPVFEERIKHGITLYRAGRVRALIFTGGVPRGDVVPESEVARDYAVRRGVPRRAIFIERRSRNTYGNLSGAKEVAAERELRRVLVVSDPLHMRRAMTMAEDLGVDADPSPTPTTRIRTRGARREFLLRETRHYAGYLLLHWSPARIGLAAAVALGVAGLVACCGRVDPAAGRTTD